MNDLPWEINDNKIYLLDELCKSASANAIKKSKALGLPIFYMDSSKNIIKEYPNGKTEIFKKHDDI